MKVLVTTASFGGYHNFPEWKIQDSEHEIVYQKYHDLNFPSRVNAFHPRMKGKIPKMMEWLFNLGYDYYIWMDSRFEISTDKSIDWFIEQCGDADICLLKHPSRNSVADEAKHVTSLLHTPYIKDRYEGEDIERQVNTYLKDKDFEDKELFACGLFIYRASLVNKDYMYNVMTQWFLQNALYSVQDQLSLPYILQRFKDITYKALDINIFNCPYFKYL